MYCFVEKQENYQYFFGKKNLCVTLCVLGNFACSFCCLWIFKKKNLLGILSECQTVLIQIRPDVLSGLIWVQTVCKDYQQMTKVATSRERVKALYVKVNNQTQSVPGVLLFTITHLIF